MVFGKKTKREEEPTHTSVVEAGRNRSQVEESTRGERPPTPGEARVMTLAQDLNRDYPVDLVGNDAERSTLLFAIYGELRRLNNGIQRLQETIEEVSK